VERQRDLERGRRSRPVDDDARGRLPELDQLAVGASPRREALGGDMQRLEQVRLAGAVRADDQNDPRLQLQVERGVRPVPAEADVPDVQ